MSDSGAAGVVSSSARDSAGGERRRAGLGQLGLASGHCALRPSAQCPVFISLFLFFLFF
jgi:hypothetical protein